MTSSSIWNPEEISGASEVLFVPGHFRSQSLFVAGPLLDLKKINSLLFVRFVQIICRYLRSATPSKECTVVTQSSLCKADFDVVYTKLPIQRGPFVVEVR